jgi:hypothetical protein
LTPIWLLPNCATALSVRTKWVVEPQVGQNPDLSRRIGLVGAAVALRFALHPDRRGVEIGPARAGLAAQGAVAFVNEFGTLFGLDADLAAKAGEFQHGRAVITSAKLRLAVYPPILFSQVDLSIIP